MSSPLALSIVVPVFNGERYLRESLDSIVTQTYPRTEVLVMDDASTDATPAMALSPVLDVELVCRSMLRAESKTRSIGAAMEVASSMVGIVCLASLPEQEQGLCGGLDGTLRRLGPESASAHGYSYRVAL